jgi:NAD+ kinase
VSQGFSSIGIIGKRGDPSVADTIACLVDYLDGRDRRTFLDADTARLLPDWRGETRDRDALGSDCDLVVVVGGDGTLLDAGRAVAPHGTPLLGVNLGRLGFMVDVLPADMTSTLDEVFAGQYVREPRLLLSAHIEYAHPDTGPLGPFFALNDVVVRNKQFARVLEFDTHMDDTFISHHRADGIIVASPTGSTAYALSGGGPVLHPALSAITLVPICPHTLSDRPLVVDARHRIEVLIGPDDDTRALFTVDGQMSQTLCAGDRVVVERADHDLTLIHPPGYDYFKILRTKLQWGRGQRALPHPP